MKIYLAGSFKHVLPCRMVGEMLRMHGHESYVFCDLDAPAFEISSEIRNTGMATTINTMTALQHTSVRHVYALNKEKLDWCDALVLLNPCGKSAHLEAGYVKGQGKKIYAITGDLIPGDWDAMYCLFDEVVQMSQMIKLVNALKE